MSTPRGPGRSLAASAVLLACACSEGGTGGGDNGSAGPDAAVTTSSGSTLGTASSSSSTLAGDSNSGGSGGFPDTSGDGTVGGSSTVASGGTSSSGGTASNSVSTTVASATSSSSGSGGSGGTSPVDPSAPLTPVGFFPSKGRTEACADASVSIRFNRTPIINSGGKLQIHEASGEVFDGVTSNLRDDLYFSDLVPRSAGGETFDSDALDVVYDTVVFQPKGQLDYGKTYYVTVDEGMITDSDGAGFSVQESDGWTFTVRGQEPASADAYVLAADGSGDYCSLEGILEALPDTAAAPRVITVKKGVYPGIVRMSESNVHFQGEGVDESIFSHKNSATMNSSREGMVITGSDITFENLTIFNTYLQDSNGQQAEALYVATSSERVFLDSVHLRSHQDTLRVDGGSVYMKGGKISGSTDPLWGYGGFYCDGCELSSRTSGHSFVVARSTKGFAMVNCRVTRDNDSVGNTYLAQYHDGSEPGLIAFANCQIDDHILGWKRPENNEWYEHDNTDLETGDPVTFDGEQLGEGSPVLEAMSSPQNWLGWSP